ncbi:MAG: TonB-dependent receptor [Spirochaetales bacterium]|nr:TonB-dependent receptor [Spirochaetales bacterium]
MIKNGMQGAAEILLLAVVIAVFPLAHVFSKDDGNDETKQVNLDDVVVTATRSEKEVLDVPQHVTVITEKELTESHADSIAKVLEKEAGISLIDYGTEGSYQALSIRGCTSSQVLVLINGVRAFGSHGGADFSLIPLENIERIEIVRGGASALYGADAVGGVINIITKKKGKNRFRISLENKSYIPQPAIKGTDADEHATDPDFLSLFDTQQAHMDVSYTFGSITLNSSVNGILARNEFVYREAPDLMRARENAELTGGDALCNVYLELPHGYLNLSGIGTYQDQGSPGSLTSSTPEATQEQTGLGTSLQYKTDTLFIDILTLDVKAFYNYFKVDYDDPLYSEKSSHITQSGGIDLTQEILASDYFSILYGGVLHYETLESLDMGDKERLNCAGFAEIPLYVNSYLTLFASLRYDYFSDFENNLNYKAGVTWKLSQDTAMKANFGKSFRAPTFNDLYWPASPWAEGNPDLKPETGYSGDLGITIMKETYNLNIFGFLRYMEDMIIWMAGEDYIWRPTNFEKGLYPGIEAEWNIQITDNLKARINYTFLYSFSLSEDIPLEDDLRVPYIPIHSLDVNLHYQAGKNTFGIHSHYEGVKYSDQANSALLPQLFIMDASYTYKVTQNFSLYLAADNLFNESSQSMANYPLPGFSLRTGCEILFN